MRTASYIGLVVAAFAIASSAFAETTPSANAKSAAQPAESGIRQSAAIARKTAFKVDPLEALHSPILRTNTGQSLATETELDLLLDANDGHVEHWSMAKAALVVCGVTDPARQKHYFAQLKQIEAGCKQATANTKNAEARARALGAYLLKEPMHAGYESRQSDLAVLLDTGKFNCVSSAVLYNMMAPRVGLQVRAVSISGHVFTRTLDFDVEPTSGKVYPLDDRNRRALKMESKNDNPLAPFNHQLFREMGNAGLLSSMYNNLASDFGKEHRYEEAVAAYLKGACLDPGNIGLVYNLRVMFGSWINHCKADHDEAQAVAIQKFAEQILRPIEVTPNATEQVARR